MKKKRIKLRAPSLDEARKTVVRSIRARGCGYARKLDRCPLVVILGTLESRRENVPAALSFAASSRRPCVEEGPYGR